MPASSATLGFGSQLFFGPAAGPAATKVAQTVDLSGPEPEVGEVEVTNNDSPDNTREYLPGLIEPGSLDFEVVYSTAQAQTLYGLVGDGLVHSWRIGYPDGSAFNFLGFVNKFGIEAPTEDEKISNTVGIKLTAKPTFSANT